MSNQSQNTKKIKGTRRIVREKVMQILAAQNVSGVDWHEIFDKIFPFEFRLEEVETPGRLLSRKEIDELEADPEIQWEPDDIEFAKDLIRKTRLHQDYADELIKRFSQNWELDRIAHVDRIVMRIAIAELLSFPEIPPKVTINEAIEIVKRYSTDKSGTFVNGILDAVLDELKEQDKLNKTGRGLLNNLPGTPGE